jgi:hypothetical protein
MQILEPYSYCLARFYNNFLGIPKAYKCAKAKKFIILVIFLTAASCP